MIGTQAFQSMACHCARACAVHRPAISTLQQLAQRLADGRRWRWCRSHGATELSVATPQGSVNRKHRRSTSQRTSLVEQKTSAKKHSRTCGSVVFAHPATHGGTISSATELLATCVLLLSRCPYSFASLPRLRSLLCPSVSFGLTLAHSAWENCTSACRKGSRTHLISRTEPIHRHRSTASSDLCLPADHHH